MNRNDPVFGLPVPLLFAHRGGAKEAPEGTLTAFDHAKSVFADVLELDVSLTADREIVVWHGPGLENVRLHHEEDVIAARTRTEIGDFTWAELDQKAWVDDYREAYSDVSGVAQDPMRRMLLLEEMLGLYPTDPINIEVKGSFAESDLARLMDVFDRSPETARRILIVSADHRTVKRLEAKLEAMPPESSRRFALGFSALQVFAQAFKTWLPLVSAGARGRALQTTYCWPLCPRRLVRKVHKKGGAVHAFITKFGPIAGLDEKKGALREEALFDVLDRGVDGIMTDRPSEARPLMDQWVRESSGA